MGEHVRKELLEIRRLILVNSLEGTTRGNLSEEALIVGDQIQVKT